MKYYLRIRGKAFGPFDEQQLVDLRDKGKLSQTSELSPNKVNWSPAGGFDFLFSPSAAAPEPQNTYALAAVQSTAPNTVTAAAPPPPPSGGPAEWYYSADGASGYGPVAVGEVVQQLQSGVLNAESLVWKDGQSAQPLKEVSVFARYISPQRTQPMQQQGAIGGSQFCVACGNGLVATAAVCPRCGTPVARQRAGYQQTHAQSFGAPMETTGIGYLDVLKKYVVFQGRARRKEFWMFQLVNSLIVIAGFVGVVFLAVVAAGAGGEDAAVAAVGLGYLVLFGYQLAIFLPALALSVRRLHDIGHSGWMVLLGLIPFVGGIILFIFFVQDSQPGDNLYGPNPKGF